MQFLGRRAIALLKLQCFDLGWNAIMSRSVHYFHVKAAPKKPRNEIERFLQLEPVSSLVKDMAIGAGGRGPEIRFPGR